MKPLPRPSTLYYLSLCCGYLPDDSSDSDTTDADRGTLLHKCVELSRPEDADNEFDRAQVLKAIEFRSDLVRRLPQSPDPRVFHELRLRSSLFPKGGTADDVILSVGNSGLEADLIDYKFGFNPVSPPGRNPQQVAYALLLFEALPELVRVRGHLLFPGLNIRATDEFTPNMIPGMTMFLKAVAGLARENRPATYCPGNACTYCARCSSCPKILETTTPSLRELVTEVLDPGTHRADETMSLFSKSPDVMDNDELRKARTVAKAGIDMLEAATAAIDKEIIGRGATLFGYRVQKRSGSWSIKDFGGLLTFLSDEYPDIFSNTSLEGVSNTFTLLSDTAPSVPITRFFAALHKRFEAEPTRTPLRYQGLSPSELRDAVLTDLQGYQSRTEIGKIIDKGTDTTFVAKAPSVGYARIFAGPEVDAIDAAATENI